MADGSRNNGNQQWHGIGNQQLGTGARLNFQLCDQRFPVTQPRQELPFPIPENQDFLGQAALQSLQETDGDPTIHNGFSVQGQADSYQLPGINPAVRPYENSPDSRDVLPMISNGGASLSSDLVLHQRPPITGQCIQETSQDRRGYVPNIQETGRYQSRKLSDSNLSDVLIRIKSFENAPSKFQTGQFKPRALAEQGLYYTGDEDELECHSCKTAMKKWEPNDDPLIEHIRLGPEQICPHLLSTLDQELLRAIKDSLKEKTVKGNPPQMTNMQDSSQDQQKPQVYGAVPMERSIYSSSNQATGNSYNLNQASYPGQSSTTPWSTQLNVAPPQHLYGRVHGQPNRGFRYRALADALFICQDCCKNKVDHTQLKCGHNICSQCVEGYQITTPNLEDRRCKTCNMRIIGYASYSPGCHN